MSLNLFLSSCSPITETKHYSTSETQEFISIRLPTMSKPNQKLGKTRDYANYAGARKSLQGKHVIMLIMLVLEKVTQLVAQALVAVRKKK